MMMELKGTELRAGNWLFNEEANEDTQIFSLGIAKICEAVIYKKPHPYKAIPIAVKWFEGFGFERLTDNPHNWYLQLPNKRVLLISDEGGCAVLIQGYGTEYQISVQASSYLILYIHQLQNLYFALVEDELIIKPKE